MGNELLNLNGKKVLITGGLGFIGSNLAHKCLELGAKVTIFDCLDPRSGGKLFNIDDIKDSIELCNHDVLNFDQISHHVPDKDIIFNCASSTSHSFSMREPWVDLDINGKGMINVLEAIRRFNRDVKFICVGTSTQLGKLHYQPADENHPEFPTDIYSANKSVSEKYTLIYSRAYNMRATVIRVSNVFGPRASIHSLDFTFNNYFMGLALQGKNVTIYGKGGQKRNIIYVEDVVSSLIMASQSEKTNGEVFFAVSDEHFSVSEIAEATVKHMGGGKVVHVDWPVGRKEVDVGDAVISNKKIKECLNWSPRFNLETGLKETKKYYDTCLKEYFM